MSEQKFNYYFALYLIVSPLYITILMLLSNDKFFTLMISIIWYTIWVPLLWFIILILEEFNLLTK